MLNRILIILFLSFSTAYAQDTGWTISNAGDGTSLGLDVETDTDGNVYTFGSFTSSVDLDPSSNGVYLVHFKSGKGMLTARIVHQ